MATVIINGVHITGSSVRIIRRAIVDGKEFPITDSVDPLRVEVVGVLDKLQVEGSVVCQEVRGDIKAGGSVKATMVGGSVTAGGSVECQNVQGDIKASGSVKCGHVDGSIKAGGSIQVR